MNYQEINDLEWKLEQDLFHLKQKHAPLKAKLKELSFQLDISLNSNEKLKIMNEMTKLEEEIKKDTTIILEQKQIIEQKKSLLRIEEWESQTVKARQKTAYYEAMRLIIKQQHSSVKINQSRYDSHNPSTNFNHWLTVINFISQQDFLTLAEMVVKKEINPLLLSQDFWRLYIVWSQLDLIESEVQACLKLLSSV